MAAESNRLVLLDLADVTLVNRETIKLLRRGSGGCGPYPLPRVRAQLRSDAEQVDA